MTYDRSQIPGWGADLDRRNRPAVPMERTPPRLEGVHWDEPSQQPRTIEVLHSLERPGITPVFGTAAPPHGASGALRRKAFGYTENDARHWMLLLAADRVDVAENMLGDAARSPRGRMLAVAGVAGLAAYLLYRRNEHRAPSRTVTISTSDATTTMHQDGAELVSVASPNPTVARPTASL